MPYQQLITVYSKSERTRLHRMGIWVGKHGDREPINQMDYERLDKLVRMLAKWAMDDDDPIRFLKDLPITPHVVARIMAIHMNTYQSSMFILANNVTFI